MDTIENKVVKPVVLPKNGVLTNAEHQVFLKAMQDMECMDDPTLHKPKEVDKIFCKSIVFPKAPSDIPFDIEGIREDRGYSPILNAEQERILFLRYNCARKLVIQWQEIFMKSRRVSDARRLIQAYNIAMFYRDYIVKMNLRIASQYAYKFMRNSILEASELISEAQLVLIHAVDKYKVSSGYKFSTYVSNSIMHAFGKINKKKAIYHSVVPAHFQDDNDSDAEPMDVPEREVNATAEQIDMIRQVIDDNTAELEPLEMKIIKGLYLDDPKVMTVSELATSLNMGCNDIKRITIKAIKKLQKVVQE